MAAPHVISALRDKRSELAGTVRQLEQQLAQQRSNLTHVDATMLPFDPDIQPNNMRPRQRRQRNAWFRPGECLRLIYDELRDAKQPVTTRDINAIRGIESASAIDTLRNRKLIARTARLGPRRERIWRTTQLFLETFGLASLDELYKEGRMEEVFASVYSGELGVEAGAHQLWSSCGCRSALRRHVWELAAMKDYECMQPWEVIMLRQRMGVALGVACSHGTDGGMPLPRRRNKNEYIGEGPARGGMVS